MMCDWRRGRRGESTSWLKARLVCICMVCFWIVSNMKCSSLSCNRDVCRMLCQVCQRLLKFRIRLESVGVVCGELSVRLRDQHASAVWNRGRQICFNNSSLPLLPLLLLLLILLFLLLLLPLLHIYFWLMKWTTWHKEKRKKFVSP